ncbi:MAG TPA: hypothetical protein VJV05_13055 [Pyrinomonadaceae bacterium]|nr:hypothetical protein [Pyrinomonadaceae bacterium]
MKNFVTVTIGTILCSFLFGCSLSKPQPPEPGKIRAALDKVIKRDNPEAAYSITSSDLHSTGTLISVKISFEKFKFKAGDGKDRDFPTGKATATFDLKKGKWILDSLQTSEPENVLLFPELPVE